MDPGKGLSTQPRLRLSATAVHHRQAHRTQSFRQGDAGRAQRFDQHAGKPGGRSLRWLAGRLGRRGGDLQLLQGAGRMAHQHQRVAAQAGPGQPSGCQPAQRRVAVSGIHDQRTWRVGAAGQGLHQFLQRQAHGAQHRRQAGGWLRVGERHLTGQQQVAAVDLGAQAGVVDQAHAVGAQAFAVVLEGGAQVGAVAVFQQRDFKTAGPERTRHRCAVAARGFQHDALAHSAHAHHQRQALALSRRVGGHTPAPALGQGRRLPAQTQHQPQPEGRRPPGPAQTHRQEIPLQTALGHLLVECSQPARIL